MNTLEAIIWLRDYESSPITLPATMGDHEGGEPFDVRIGEAAIKAKRIKTALCLGIQAIRSRHRLPCLLCEKCAPGRPCRAAQKTCPFPSERARGLWLNNAIFDMRLYPADWYDILNGYELEYIRGNPITRPK